MNLRWCLPVLLLVPSLSQAQFPFLRSLEVRSGQRRPQITTLVQDSLGLIWTGSDIGVLRTDGESVDPMLHTEVTRVSAMHPDGGSVIVALTNGSLFRCAKGICDTIVPDTRLAASPIRSIALLQNGIIGLGTYGAGVWFVKPDGLVRVALGQGLPDDHVNDIAVLDGQRVVVATDQGLAVVSPQGVEQVFDGAGGAPDNLVMAVAVMRDGTVVAGTHGHGVFRWRPGSRKAELLVPDWTHGPVTDIAVDDDRIWVGTARSGVVVFDGGPIPSIYNRPVPGGAVSGLWRDREGAMWWCDGTEHIHRADPAILFVPEHEGLDLRTVSAVCVDGAERIWVATPAGIHHHPSAFGEGRHLTRIPLDLDQRTPVVSLAATRSGMIWAATFGSGVLAVSPSGEVRRYSTAHGLRNDNVLAVRALGDSVWFATLDGACLWDGRAFSNVKGTSGFAFDVLPLATDRALIATDGQGVLAYADGEATTLRTEARTFYALVKDDGGSAWAMGPDAGLCRVAGGATVCLGADLPVFGGDLFALTISRGRVMVFGSAGAMALDPITGSWVDLSGRTGITGVQAELNAVARSADGSVWFACDRGLVRLRLNDHHFDVDIPVVMTGIFVNGDPMPDSDVIWTTYDRNDITLRFTGLHYSDPGGLRFEYRLGYDGDVLRTRDRELAFADLAPGTHHIQIRAFIGGSGTTAEWRTVTVHVAPPWWRRPWVIALLLLAVSGVVVAVVRTRERRMRDRERMEQEKVRFQLEALRSQVDPHFLFNSFNTLVSLIETEPGKAVEHVDDLSTFFRNILLVRDKDLIPLAEELELLRNYFDLEHRRFGSAIELVLNAQPVEKDLLIVPLTLQLLVENALKHNVATVQDPLAVQVSVIGDQVVVSNPIRPRATTASSTGFGLESIVKRYTAISSRPVAVERSSERFVVRIPLLKRDEHPAR